MKRTWLAAALAAGIAGCSGAGDSSGVSQATANAWPEKWCQAEPGITKDALVAIMGAPTGASDKHATWTAHEYQFNAFLDPDGTVRQLDTNTHSLSEKQKGALTCDTIRSVGYEDSRKAKAAAKPGRTTYPLACTLVTAGEMSAILGYKVVAEPNERSSGTTACSYKKPAGLSPDVDLTVTWGDGEVAMKAMGLANRHEPGLTSPYDGVGDEAAAVGPALFVRSGEDLIKMVFSGVDDAPAAAKKIFDTAKAKM